MNKYKLFDTPKKVIEDMIQEIKQAKKTIFVDIYAIRGDRIGRQFLKALAKKSKQIRIVAMVDSWGSRLYDERIEHIIRKSKIEFVRYNPIIKGLLNITQAMKRIRTRNHRKMLIIDNSVAYVGGVNIHKRELRWRDFHVKIKGKIITKLKKHFWEMYTISKSKEILHPKTDKELNTYDMDEDVILRQIPHTKHKQITTEITNLIKQAKKEVRLCTPYFVPTDTFFKTLKEAGKRGVRVSVITAGKADYKFSTILNKYYAQAARKINVQTYMYPKMIHAKYLIIDDTHVSFGSANMDQQTEHSNYELNIVSKNRNLYKQFNKVWTEDKQKARLFTERMWIRRPQINRFIEPILLRAKTFF